MVKLLLKPYQGGTLVIYGPRLVLFLPRGCWYFHHLFTLN